MAKPPYPKTNAEKAKLYLHAMVEVKERLHVAAEILALPIAPLFKQELCYLQFRYICELIAIACLAAQGDYETQRTFTESYKPPEIFKALRKLYPNCFPVPAERIVTEGNGNRHHHVEHSHKPDAYAEGDVSALWKSAGDHLHRASVRKYIRTTFDNKPPDLDQVARHLNGLVRLLDSHLIPIQTDAQNEVMLLIELGQRHQPARILFLRLNREEGSIQIENFEAALVR